MKLDSHNVNTTITAIIRDKHGNVKDIVDKDIKPKDGRIDVTQLASDGIPKKHIVMPFRSWIGNFCKVLFSVGICNNSSSTRTYETDGTYNDWTHNSFSADYFPMLGGINSLDGIRIGSGSAANTIDMYEFTEHTPSSTFMHYDQTFTTPTSNGSGYEFTITRTIVNRTGGDQSVREIVLVNDLDYGDWTMIARDILDSEGSTINITLSDGEPLTIKYTFPTSDNSGFTRQFNEGLYSMFVEANMQARSTTYGDTPVLRSCYWDYGHAWAARPGSGLDATGIMVGTDGSALDTDSYALGSKINHGTGAGELSYGTSSEDDYTSDGDTGYCQLRRTFTNNSGGAITINELGVAIAGEASVQYGADDNKFLIYRGLTGGVTVNDTEAVEFIVKWSVSV